MSSCLLAVSRDIQAMSENASPSSSSAVKPSNCKLPKRTEIFITSILSVFCVYYISIIKGQVLNTLIRKNADLPSIRSPNPKPAAANQKTSLILMSFLLSLMSAC